ncbi:ribosome biogenesis GTPase YlqF [uncultured Granulicatella sp.]|uniref:ribosome biogenesis GTPase YlqF n=1 Tax=uncultured Granulicatella sp. TaxID=316089 RepID=UPI00260F8F75|nr:ribosome biogenesis GTPase YlqF [uncultured Granulicatella sp.]
MATIQWFPGHMAKARREATEKLKLVDVVIEMVDARIPESSRNPIIEEIKGQKKQLILLNKVDLADPSQTKRWNDYFTRQGIKVLSTEAKDGKGIKQVKAAIKELIAPIFEKNLEKGIRPRPIRLMVLGIPNVGKSTFINRMINKNQAETANRPGVTKGQRWLKIGNDFELLDTPGILWPKFESEEVGNKLALTGAIKDALLHMDDIALFALGQFKLDYPEYLKKAYRLIDSDLELSNVDLLMLITKNLGFKEDYEKASERIVFDIRSGKLGRYTLDQAPVSVTEEA